MAWPQGRGYRSVTLHSRRCSGDAVVSTASPPPLPGCSETVPLVEVSLRLRNVSRGLGKPRTSGFDLAGVVGTVSPGKGVVS